MVIKRFYIVTGIIAKVKDDPIVEGIFTGPVGLAELVSVAGAGGEGCEVHDALCCLISPGW